MDSGRYCLLALGNVGIMLLIETLFLGRWCMQVKMRRGLGLPMGAKGLDCVLRGLMGSRFGEILPIRNRKCRDQGGFGHWSVRRGLGLPMGGCYCGLWGVMGSRFAIVLAIRNRKCRDQGVDRKRLFRWWAG